MSEVLVGQNKPKHIHHKQETANESLSHILPHAEVQLKLIGPSNCFETVT